MPELSTLSLSSNQEENVKAIAGKPKAREIAVIVPRSFDKERYVEKIIAYIKANIPKSMLSKKGMEIVDPEIDIDFQK